MAEFVQVASAHLAAADDLIRGLTAGDRQRDELSTATLLSWCVATTGCALLDASISAEAQVQSLQTMVVVSAS